MTLTKQDLQEIRTIVNESGEDVKKDIKNEIRKEIKTVVKKLDEMDNFLDRRDIQNEQRIIRIENKVGIPTAI